MKQKECSLFCSFKSNHEKAVLYVLKIFLPIGCYDIAIKGVLIEKFGFFICLPLPSKVKESLTAFRLKLRKRPKTSFIKKCGILLGSA